MATAEDMGLTVETFGDAVVVDDREMLWTADAALFAGALGSLDLATYEHSDDAGPARVQAYEDLCGRVPYLARREPARHEQTVAAWRLAHPGCSGNWS